MSAELMKAAMAHYGLDWDDPIYAEHMIGTAASGWCTLCHRHYDDRHTRRCDLEKARKAELEDMGYRCRTCFHCSQVFPRFLDQGGICPACKTRQDRRDAAVRSRRYGRGPDVRVPDGLGCTERLPAWMIDWDGNPNG